MMDHLEAEYEKALYRLEKQQILLMDKPGWFPGSRIWRKFRYNAQLREFLSLQKKLIGKKPEAEKDPEEKKEGLTGLAFRVAGKTSFLWLPFKKQIIESLDALDWGSEAGGTRLWKSVMVLGIVYALILLTIFAYVLYLESGSILAPV